MPVRFQKSPMVAILKSNRFQKFPARCPAAWVRLGLFLHTNSTLNLTDTNASHFQMRFHRLLSP